MLLFTGAVWEGFCAHSIYDLHHSTEDCVRVRLKSLDIADDCTDPDATCATPATVQQTSPRWLSNLAGTGGPLMTWLPLLLGNKEAAPVHHVLLTALPWCGPPPRCKLPGPRTQLTVDPLYRHRYLAFIGPDER